MPLAWVRLDTNIATHDKILRLLHGDEALRWRAFSSYVCSIGWAGGAGTDGGIEPHALPVIYGTPRTAQLLVEAGLWDYSPDPRYRWVIHNFADYQQLEAVTQAKSEAAARAANIRHHGRPRTATQNGK